MPIPGDNEDKQDFISRCIKDLTENESDKFPSKEQRVAVCYSIWRKHKEKKEEASFSKLTSKHAL